MKTIKAAAVALLVILPGCGGGSNLITDPDLLSYTASSQVTSTNPMRFSTTVVIVNTTTTPLSFTHSCPIPRTLVYATAARTGTPIWDSNTRNPAVNCATPTLTTIGVNKSVSYTLTATGAEVLGATGIAGTYYLVDEVTLDGTPYRVSAGEVALTR